MAQLNMNFGISHYRYYYLKKRQRLWEPLLIIIGIGSVVLTIGVGVFKLASSFYSQLGMLGHGNAVLTMGILSSQVIVLILGFTLVLAVFYFSNDLSILIPMPLAPVEVLASKFAVILANEYVGTVVFIFPIFYAYAVNAGGGFFYWVSAVLVFLTLPVIPLVLAAIPAILLMRVTNLSKMRDALILVGGFFFMFLAIGFQFFINTKMIEPGEEELFLQRILETANGFVELIGAKFPPSIWGTRAMAEAGTASGFMYLALFIGVSAAGLGLLFLIGNKFFYQGALSGFETHTKRRKGAIGDIPGRRFKERSPLIAIVFTEIKNFIRTPVFVLNGFTGFIMFPAMLILFKVIKDPQTAALWELVNILELKSIGALIIAGYIFILVSFSSIPFTTFSREGRRGLWIPMSLPIDAKSIMVGKALGAEIMILIGSIPGLVIIEYLFKIPAPYFFAGLVIGVIASMMYSIVGTIIDMARPMLNWIDEQKAIKSNLNTIIGMLVGIAIVAVIVLLTSFLYSHGFSDLIILAFVGGVIIVGFILSWNLCGFLAGRIWVNLEP